MSPNRKKGLGRGLSALFGDEKPIEKQANSSTLNKVSISDLSRNPYQPRQNFSNEKLNELSNKLNIFISHNLEEIGILKMYFIVKIYYL